MKFQFNLNSLIINGKDYSFSIFLMFIIIVFPTDNAFASYCPLGACKGVKVESLYTSQEEAQIMLSENSFVATAFFPKLNKEWTKILEEDHNTNPGNIVYSSYYTENLGVCSNYFLHLVEEKDTYPKLMEDLKNRIKADTKFEGQLSEYSKRQEVNYIWEGEKVSNIEDVYQIILTGNNSKYPTQIGVHILYDNYLQCRKENSDIPEPIGAPGILQSSINFILALY